MPPIKNGQWFGFIPMGKDYIKLPEEKRKKILKFVLSNSYATTDWLEIGRKDCEE